MIRECKNDKETIYMKSIFLVFTLKSNKELTNYKSNIRPEDFRPAAAVAPP